MNNKFKPGDLVTTGLEDIYKVEDVKSTKGKIFSEEIKLDGFWRPAFLWRFATAIEVAQWKLRNEV